VPTPEFAKPSGAQSQPFESLLNELLMERNILWFLVMVLAVTASRMSRSRPHHIV
jgi:hypothetical protein